MKLDKHTTDVIFRVHKEGDVLALFPSNPGTNDPYTCECYAHVGQHGSADATALWRKATPAQYKALARELRGLGYRLRVVQRFTRHHLSARKVELARMHSK